jgi:hypothetical protein
VGLVFVNRDKTMTLQLTTTVGYSIPNLKLHNNTSKREFLYMMLLDKAFIISKKSYFYNMLHGDTMYHYNGLKYIAINMVTTNNMVGGDQRQ